MAVLLQRVLEHTPIATEPTDPAVPSVPGNPDLSDGYKLALDQSRITLASGGSVTLSAAILPAVSGAEVTWSSSDPGAAVVSAAGMVTNLYPGKGDKTVTVTASWNGLTASCAVTCQPARWVGAVNAESGLRVRSGPDTTYTAVGTLQDKERVVVLSQLWVLAPPQSPPVYVNQQKKPRPAPSGTPRRHIYSGLPEVRGVRRLDTVRARTASTTSRRRELAVQSRQRTLRARI